MKLYKSLISALRSNHDKSQWKLGEWRYVAKPEEQCIGLNCSETPLDAMCYVNCEIIAEVEADGVIIKTSDKWTCEKMRVKKAWIWEKKDSVKMAIYCAELVIKEYENKYPDDKRPREAIKAAKAWLKNPCKETEAAAYAASAAASAPYAAAYAAYAAANAAAHAANAAANAANAATNAANAATKLKINRWIIKHIKTLKVYEEVG